MTCEHENDKQRKLKPLTCGRHSEYATPPFFFALRIRYRYDTEESRNVSGEAQAGSSAILKN